MQVIIKMDRQELLSGQVHFDDAPYIEYLSEGGWYQRMRTPSDCTKRMGFATRWMFWALRLVWGIAKSWGKATGCK